MGWLASCAVRAACVLALCTGLALVVVECSPVTRAQGQALVETEHAAESDASHKSLLPLVDHAFGSLGEAAMDAFSLMASQPSDDGEGQQQPSTTVALQRQGAAQGSGFKPFGPASLAYENARISPGLREGAWLDRLQFRSPMKDLQSESILGDVGDDGDDGIV